MDIGKTNSANWLHILRPLFLIVLFSLLNTNLHAQSSKGTDFWAGFLINSSESGTINLTLTAVGHTGAVVTVDNVITGWRATATLTSSAYANLTSATIEIPYSAGLIPSPSAIHTRGLHITSTDDIELYAMNYREASCDIATILPTAQLGTTYIVQDYASPTVEGLQNIGGAEILFVATTDSTVLNMTLPCTTNPATVPAGQPLSVTLYQGQTYLLTTPSPNQFSGMTVTGNHPFAMFQGNKIAAVVNGDHHSGDHIYEQAIPLSYWGNDFMVISSQGRSWGDLVRILSSADSCRVTVNGNNLCTLQSGQSHDYHLPPNSARHIHTSQPASLTLLTASSTWEVETGDVASATIIPMEYGANEAIFDMPQTDRTVNYHINIACASSVTSGMTLDGNNIASSFTTSGAYSYARIPTTAGLHALGNNLGTFTAHAYAMGNVEGYAFPLCRSFPMVSNDTITVYDTICYGQNYDTLGVHLHNAGPIDLGTTIYQRDVVNGGIMTHYIIFLTVLPAASSDIYDTIAYGDTLLFDGIPLSAEGLYTFSYSMPWGCDSIVRLHLSYRYIAIDIYDTICCGQSYADNGFNLPVQTIVGTHIFQRDTIELAVPTRYLLHLTVLPTFTTLIQHTIIAGDTLFYSDTTLTAAGDYTFHYTAANGCDSTVTIHLSYEAIGITADKDGVCPGEPVVITASGTHTFLWTASPTAPELDAQQGANPITVHPEVSTTYCLVDQNDSTLACLTVGTAPPPVPCVESNRDILDFDNPTLSLLDCSEGRYTTTWTFDDGQTQTGQRAVRTWGQETFVNLPDSVHVTMATCNRYNCCADTSLSFPMKILSVWFPNIFTPDAETNNLFGCHTSHDVEAYELVIFNRWGLQLWSTTDINQGWDGRRADGSPCPQGAYVYRYYLRSTDGTFDNGIGTVTLLR